MITITLNEIRASNPCSDAWEAKALAYLHRDKIDNTPVTFAQIIEACGLRGAIYCLRCLPEADRWRVQLFARSCAGHVLHLWDAPQVVKDFLRTGKNAKAAARDAELDAGAAERAARDAELDAGAAERAARAAWADTWAATWAAEAAWAATWAAEAARDAAELSWQAQELVRIMDLPDVPESRIINF